MATRRLEALPEIANVDLTGKINPVYLPHLLTVHEKEVYYGGGAESTFIGGQKLPLQMTMYEGRNLVCLRSQKSDCLASCWAEVYNGLDKLGLIGYWEIKQNPVHKMINRIYGNEILFEGLDNIEDIKSIKFTRKGSKVGDANVTDIWYEEVNAEPNKEVIEELVRRLRDPEIKCRLILTFNPVTRTHWLYDYVMRDLQLPGVDSLILKTTYLDNKFCHQATEKI
jgi:Phage terminase large subunit